MAVVGFCHPRGAIDVVQHASDDLYQHAALGHTGGNGASEIVPSEIEPQAAHQLSTDRRISYNGESGRVKPRLYAQKCAGEIAWNGNIRTNSDTPEIGSPAID